MANEMYALGCRPDPRDDRDHLLTAAPVGDLPEAHSWRDILPPVRNQLNEGICVGFSTAAMLEAFEAKSGRQTVLSPRYLYFLCKRLDGAPGEQGTYPRIAMKVANDMGTVQERLLPYRPNQQVDPALVDALAPEAAPYRTQSYARIRNVEDLEAALYHNGPVVAGVTVYRAWYSVGADGIVPMDRTNPLGGHAILIVGYNRATRLLEFRNSWGGWGNSGYGYLPYDYLTDDGADLWTAVDCDPNPPAGVKVFVPSVWVRQENDQSSASIIPCTVRRAFGDLWKRLWKK